MKYSELQITSENPTIWVFVVVLVVVVWVFFLSFFFFFFFWYECSTPIHHQRSLSMQKEKIKTQGLFSGSTIVSMNSHKASPLVPVPRTRKHMPYYSAQSM